jgi:hypothetical protein
LVDAIEVVANVAADIVAGVTTPLGLGSIEHLAQLGTLGPIDGIADSVLSRWKASSGKLSLHPLDSIWSKFDLHGFTSFRA